MRIFHAWPRMPWKYFLTDAKESYIFRTPLIIIVIRSGSTLSHDISP